MKQYVGAEMEIVKLNLGTEMFFSGWCVDKTPTGCGFDGGYVCDEDNDFCEIEWGGND